MLKPVRRRAASIFEFLQPVSQQSVENIRIQELERWHHHICRQKLAILAYAYAFHPGGAGCFDTVLRVFDNNAMLGRDTQIGGGDEEHLWVRLAPVYILSGHDGLKLPASV